MPKTVSVALKSHIAGEVTTLCTCFQITRRDGAQLFFTDHDQDLVVSGNTHLAAVGYTRTAMATNTDLSVDNQEFTGLFDDDSITTDDLRSGLYDFAEVKIFLLNWADLTQSILRLSRGYLGEVSMRPSGIFVTELRGLVQRLQQTVGELYTPACRADLGDSRCQVDLTLSGGFLQPATVATVTDQQHFTITVTEPRAVDGWFVDGLVSFTSGENDGRSMEVKGWTQSTSAVALFLPMPRPVVVGDTLTIYPGCAKDVPACRDKFDNILNMRAEPYVPGMDAILTNAKNTASKGSGKK
jgi:uncharacterized phage protein (TIGR02218 family)